MSEALYSIAGLRFWSENEIELREAFQARVASVIRRTLISINPAFRMMRTEGPILTERKTMAAYGDDDVFAVDWQRAGTQWALRAETTASSYRVAKTLGKLPLCVWQVGKSFRKEENDGASAAKLRFNEFWQQEFQVIYRDDTKADYRSPLVSAVSGEVRRFLGLDIRVVESDRLPPYSLSTIDIEAQTDKGWREIASCSIRKDYEPGVLVTEIAIGLCRVAELARRIGED